ncbi:aminotransferase class V-fold PLP-dependent enzyme [Candidatus Saccharibacteria bacterium]|nr:aminotransferase class V-fold PLP-dependent enzyme [Candidatus Saccharibacteria bacterium]
MSERLFLDYNAGAPLLPEARAAALQTMQIYGNPNGLHEESRHASAVILRAREQVARLINAHPEEIFFFPSASLANYFLVTSFARVRASPFEHPSIIKSISESDSVRPTLVSHMLANNETGEIYNIEHFYSNYPSAKKHSDLSQAVGKIPIDIQKLNLDFATISSQKIGGGKGSAALYIRGGDSALKEVKPLKYRLYALGTPNVVAIASFGAAADKAYESAVRFNTKIQPLVAALHARIQSEIPNSVINTPVRSLPNTLNVSFPGAEGESIMLMLDARGVAVSTGSACTTTDGAPSHVLMAMYQDKSEAEAAELAHSSIRFSFSPDSPSDSVERVMAVLPGVIAQLRGFSTANPAANPTANPTASTNLNTNAPSTEAI